MSRVNPKTSDGPKIVAQYRTKHGRVCQLKSGESVLAVHILRPEPPGDDDAGTWHVEVRTNANDTHVDGWGPTAAEALKDVARAWTSRSPSLISLDWEAIAHELHLVRVV